MRETDEAVRIAAARAGDQQAFSELTERYRRELQVHCYRILGSLHDAEDMVQETLLRAWRRLSTFEGRASFRAWLYTIATNACLDALDRRPRRALPPARYPPADPRAPFAPLLAEPIWIEPFPDELLAGMDTNPEARYTAHESVTLAFLVALQALPPRQRAVLILRDVLDWHASEVAALLGLTVPAVNSALHRARTTLNRHYHAGGMEAARVPPPADEPTRTLLTRYVRAWEEADVVGLTALLKEDAALSMPPTPSWYQGRAAIGTFFAATIFDGATRGRWRLRPVGANAQPAFAVYQHDPSAGAYRAFGIQVVTLEGGQVQAITSFNGPTFLAPFGVPETLDI